MGRPPAWTPEDGLGHRAAVSRGSRGFSGYRAPTKTRACPCFSPRCLWLPVSPAPRGALHTGFTGCLHVPHAFCLSASLTTPPGLHAVSSNFNLPWQPWFWPVFTNRSPLAPPLPGPPQEEHTRPEIHQAKASRGRALWRALVWSEGKRRVLEENYRVRRG